MNTKIFGRRRGDTILEVMVALFLLSAILTGTFSILNRAIATNVNVKNRIIALNIAREGMEAIRNIRDTNWLKYSGDRRGKWLCLDAEGTDSCVGADSQIDDGTGTYYLVDYSEANNRYYLTSAPIQSDLDLTSAAQIATGDQDDYILHLDTTDNRYSHSTSGTSEPSNFYREIYLQAINPFEEEATKPTFCDNASDEPDCFYSRLKVRARTLWMEDGRPHRVVLEGHLFDFFERKDYD